MAEQGWEVEALRLHLEGLTYRAIGEKVGRSHVAVQKHVKRLLDLGNPSDQAMSQKELCLTPSSAFCDFGNPFARLPEPYDPWGLDEVPDHVPLTWDVTMGCNCEIPMFLVKKPTKESPKKKWLAKKVLPDGGLGRRTCPLHGLMRYEEHRKRIENNHSRQEMAFGVFESTTEGERAYRAAVRYASEERSSKRGEEAIAYVMLARRSGLRLMIAPKVLTPRKVRLPDGSRGFLMQETGNSLVLDGFEVRVSELRERSKMVSVREWQESRPEEDPKSYTLGYWTPELKEMVEDELGVRYGGEVTDEQEQKARQMIDDYWKKKRT